MNVVQGPAGITHVAAPLQPHHQRPAWRHPHPSTEEITVYSWHSVSKSTGDFARVDNTGECWLCTFIWRREPRRPLLPARGRPEGSHRPILRLVATFICFQVLFGKLPRVNKDCFTRQSSLALPCGWSSVEEEFFVCALTRCNSWPARKGAAPCDACKY